jgi:anaerobic selenocysteine-containing dehydrogenase
MVADAIRQPVVEPDRDVRGFQDVLIDLGARLGLPGIVKEDGSPAYPGGYPITWSTTSASRGSARCRAGAVRMAPRPASGAPNPTS